MSNLIVVAYEDQNKAEEVRTKLRKLQQDTCSTLRMRWSRSRMTRAR
jgi:uncharacterized membrane protein